MEKFTSLAVLFFFSCPFLVAFAQNPQAREGEVIDKVLVPTLQGKPLECFDLNDKGEKINQGYTVTLVNKNGEAVTYCAQPIPLENQQEGK
jgi:hypothetical protein